MANKQIIYTTLTTHESTLLDSYNVRIRKTKGVFINSSGYKTLKTTRNNIPCLSDKIVCIHTLISWYESGKDIADCRHIYKTCKLQTHHIDGNKLNNNIHNLHGFITKWEHNKLEYALNKEKM